MFTKKVKVYTRLENGDNLKVLRLIDTYTEMGSYIAIRDFGHGIVENEFTLRKGLIKQFKHDLAILDFVGVEAKFEV